MASPSLGSLLEEPSPNTSILGHDSLYDDMESTGEPVPTLPSLLVATAEELMAQQKLPTSGSSTSSKSPSPFPWPINLPANPAALLSDPAAKSYLSSLLAQPLTSLRGLPSSLAALSTSLDTDLSSLAFTRYSSFLLSHSATQSISDSFDSLSDSLSSLLDSTSALDAAAVAFESRVHQVRRKREHMKRVKDHIDSVENLLDASSVVDACVRAGYWNEAIEIAARLADMHARLSLSSVSSSTSNLGADDEDEDSEYSNGKGALLLLNRVRDEISLALLALRARVLDSLLQRGLKLPAAVRGITILRRMNTGGLGLERPASSKGKEILKESAKAGLEEEALRIVFLAARWKCLRAELDAVEGQMVACGVNLTSSSRSSTQQNGNGDFNSLDDSMVGPEENDERTRWAKRWIEIWREIVGETVGMYNEVFLIQTPTTTSSPSDFFKLSYLSPTSPLSLFLAASLESLTSTLFATLPALTSPSSLSSILTQLSYCSHSFARYGLEFREIEQVRERVEARVGVVVIAELEVAGIRWEKEWRDGWESGIRRRGKERKGMASWLVVAEGLPTVLATPLPPELDSNHAARWQHQPSPSLALLPPLARLLNAHATALNSLRLLPAISLYPLLRRAQGKALDRATQVLVAFVDAWASSMDAHPIAGAEYESLSNDEKVAEAIRVHERKLIVFALAAFARWVVPWCMGALRTGVYSELEGSGLDISDALAEDAIRKAEGLVAKVEGRDQPPSPVGDAPAPPVIDTEPSAQDGSTSQDESGPPPPPSSSTQLIEPKQEALQDNHSIRIEAPPPPALEPELELPPSLNPKAEPPSPTASLAPSLEPTVERTDDLILDPPPISHPIVKAPIVDGLKAPDLDFDVGESSSVGEPADEDAEAWGVDGGDEMEEREEEEVTEIHGERKGSTGAVPLKENGAGDSAAFAGTVNGVHEMGVDV
ncbi:hypothetical protein T439DRAFT_297338 [Meredithblackwellia eburnea MCA 4105]